MQELRTWQNEVRGLSARWTEDEIQKFADGSDPQHYPNTNWYDVVQKELVWSDKANIQLTGGMDNLTYLVSAGFPGSRFSLQRKLYEEPHVQCPVKHRCKK